MSFRLPERVFAKPLARALVEQRRNLALDANAQPRVLDALDALALAPEKFTPNAGIYLGLRSIYWRLVRATSDDDLRDVVTRLWSMATQIEDGEIADAQANLRNAEEALRQALERGASDEEIKALMEQLRAAMDRFMQALAQQLKNNPQAARPLGPNSRVVSQRDLQNMLDQFQKHTETAKRLAKILAEQMRLRDRTTNEADNSQLESLSRDEGQLLQYLQRLIDQLPR